MGSSVKRKCHYNTGIPRLSRPPLAKLPIYCRSYRWVNRFLKCDVSPQFVYCQPEVFIPPFYFSVKIDKENMQVVMDDELEVITHRNLPVCGPFWCNHTSWNRDPDRNQEIRGCMKQCGNFRITRGLKPIIPIVPCSCPGHRLFGRKLECTVKKY